jgi:chaperonin GroES
MSFVPLYDQVLVVDVSQEHVIDGIILPETSKDDVIFSRVISVGDGLRVKVGDVIARGMYSGIPLRLEGVEFFLLKEAECLGKVT